MKNLTKKFNHPHTLLVVSSYPDPKTGVKNLDAVAWHCQKTLKSLSQHQKIIVFSEINSQKKPYLDNKNILIIPIWQKGKPLSFFKALLATLKFTHVQTILFQFEFNIFGGLLPLFFIPPFLLIFRLLGKKIIFEFHQVVANISQISTHLNLKNPILLKLFNLGLQTFYQTVGLLSNHIITLEQQLKTLLSRLITANKISFIPISTPPKYQLSPALAKEKLGFKPTDFVIVSFGFINWYKGSDWLIKAFPRLKTTNTKLILAGGPSPTLKSKPYYQSYYKHLLKSIKPHQNIQITGFIPDQQVKLYFSAADLVVFPYRVFISSSGPLSLAFSYRKPILLSSILVKNYSISPDFSQALTKTNLQPADISFPLNAARFPAFIRKAKKNLAALTRLSSLIAQARRPQITSQKYQQIINSFQINHDRLKIKIIPTSG